jgi:hypothetical protein
MKYYPNVHVERFIQIIETKLWMIERDKADCLGDEQETI